MHSWFASSRRHKSLWGGIGKRTWHKSVLNQTCRAICCLNPFWRRSFFYSNLDIVVNYFKCMGITWMSFMRYLTWQTSWICHFYSLLNTSCHQTPTDLQCYHWFLLLSLGKLWKCTWRRVTLPASQSLLIRRTSAALSVCTKLRTRTTWLITLSCIVVCWSICRICRNVFCFPIPDAVTQAFPFFLFFSLQRNV